MNKIREPWRHFEQYVQVLLGLDSTPSSGNQFNDPGDGVDRGHSLQHEFPLMIDAKFSEKSSFSFSAKMFDQGLRQAAMAGKRMAWPVRLWPRYDLHPHDLVVLSLEDFVDLVSMRRQET